MKKNMLKPLSNLFANKIAILGLLMSYSAISGCSSIKPWVQPYERQNLADPIMKANRHGVASIHAAHVFEARESARGAEGTGGGGCGCN